MRLADPNIGCISVSRKVRVDHVSVAEAGGFRGFGKVEQQDQGPHYDGAGKQYILMRSCDMNCK